MIEAKEALKQYFGYDEFIGLQEEIIYTITELKKHSLVMMPTGSGKSLCYQLPALMFDGGTIVISPLIALMKDQVDALKKKGIPAAFINSSVSKDEKSSRLRTFIKGKIKLLYVTPERFRKKEFAEEIKKANISLVAIDEAHSISEWGHDFRPDYSRIAEFREILGNPLTIALTATATPKVQKDIVEKAGIDEDDIMIFHQGIERPNLRLEAAEVFDEKDKLDKIIEIIDNNPGSGIIYFSLIKTLEGFSEKLDRLKIPHLTYHGKLPAKKRKQNQEAFINGKNKVVLATNAFGMGIDKPDIRYVVHGEMPGSLESYYQEIGRAGRDGLDSRCLMLYNEQDLNIQMDFINWSNPDEKFYGRLFAILESKMPEVIAEGIEFLRGELVFKNKNDFRLETAMNMLDRYGAIEGSLEKNNLTMTGIYPSELFDKEFLDMKLKSDRMRLLDVVKYFRSKHCRKSHLSKYFGFEREDCGNCDKCDGKEIKELKQSE